MTIAICLECGEFKFGAFNPCSKCGAKPRDVDQLALSLACSDHYCDKATLEHISKIIQTGREPVIDRTLVQRITEELSENKELLKGLEVRWR